jgi:hypothetical protein
MPIWGGAEIEGCGGRFRRRLKSKAVEAKFELTGWLTELLTEKMWKNTQITEITELTGPEGPGP